MIYQEVMRIKDPLAKFDDGAELEQWLGTLPKLMNNLDFTHLREQIESSYLKNSGGYCYEMEGAHLSVDGVWSYPEDDDLYPIFVFVRNNELVYVYMFGLVAFANVDENGDLINVFCTRMD